MSSADVTIREVRLDIEERTFDRPFGLSGTTLATLPQATAAVTVTDARGREATGRSTGFLSTGWAFPTKEAAPEAKDAAMRHMARRMAEVLGSLTEAGDPLQHAAALDEHVPVALEEAAQDLGLEVAIPRLAASVCMASLDGAVWDAWGRARGAPSLEGLDGSTLNLDLGAYLGASHRGQWPAQWLTAPRRYLRVQHVLGVSDQLDGPDAPPGQLPASLREWVQRDGTRRLKLKVSGSDPAADAQRVVEAHETARRALGDVPAHQIRIALDPNEACPDTTPVHRLLDQLERDAAPARAALDYIEQPTPRDVAPADMASLTERVPVVIDEGLGDLGDLARVVTEGWSGVAVKTGKGFSHALLAYCWARARGHAVVIQDLTNPGLGMVHSAALARRLECDSDAFECNSRQYVPSANAAEAEQWPELFTASGGTVDAGRLTGPGLS